MMNQMRRHRIALAVATLVLGIVLIVFATHISSSLYQNAIRITGVFCALIAPVTLLVSWQQVGDSWILLRGWVLCYRRRYFQKLSKKLNPADQAPDGLRSLPFKYVDIRLRPRSHSPVAYESRSPRVAGKSVWDYLIVQETRGQSVVPRLVVVSGPGSGKTTLLRSLVWQTHHIPSYAYRLVPFLFELRHTKLLNVISTNPTLNVIKALGVVGIGLSDSQRYWLDLKLSRGCGLILIDGLDEVRDESLRPVRDWIDYLLSTYKHNRLIITARPGGYDAFTRQGQLAADPLEIAHLDRHGIKQFIMGWYATHIKQPWYRPRHRRREAAQRNANKLFHYIERSTRLFSFATEPLLLTLLVNLYYDGTGELPKQRCDLYEAACRLLLRKHAISATIHPDRMMAVLKLLAYKMVQHAQVEIERDKGVSILQPLRAQGTLTVSPDTFFNAFSAPHAGLLIEKERDLFCFVHRSFQEYLCASYLVQTPAEVVRQFDASWPETLNAWGEVIVWYAAHCDVSPILVPHLRRLHPSAVVITLAIANLNEEPEAYQRHGDLATEVASLAEGMSEKFNDKSRAFVESLLQDRCTGMIPLDDGRIEKDMSLLTCAEYQLFINEWYAQYCIHWPDHWPDQHFPSKMALSVVAGVRVADAQAFCQWLSTRDRNWHYRLPQEHELADLGATLQARSDQTSTMGYWYCRQDGSYALAESPASQGLTANCLSATINADMNWAQQTVKRLSSGKQADQSFIRMAQYVVATVERLKNPRETVQTKTVDHVNKQPLDIDWITRQARDIEEAIVGFQKQCAEKATHHAKMRDEALAQATGLEKTIHVEMQRAYEEHMRLIRLIKGLNVWIQHDQDVIKTRISDLKEDLRPIRSKYNAAVRECNETQQPLDEKIKQLKKEISQLMAKREQEIKEIRATQPVSSNSIRRTGGIKFAHKRKTSQEYAIERKYSGIINQKQQKVKKLQSQQQKFIKHRQQAEARKKELSLALNQLTSKKNFLVKIHTDLNSLQGPIAVGTKCMRFIWTRVLSATIDHARRAVASEISPPELHSYPKGRLVSRRKIGCALGAVQLRSQSFEIGTHNRIMTLANNLPNDMKGSSIFTGSGFQSTEARNTLYSIKCRLEAANEAAKNMLKAVQTARQHDRDRNHAEELHRQLDPFHEYAQRLRTLCAEHIAPQTSSHAESRKEHRRQARLYALALANTKEVMNAARTEQQAQWQRWFAASDQESAITPIALTIYVQLVLFEERIAGRLTACEGIRLIRERRR